MPAHIRDPHVLQGADSGAWRDDKTFGQLLHGAPGDRAFYVVCWLSHVLFNVGRLTNGFWLVFSKL